MFSLASVTTWLINPFHSFLIVCKQSGPAELCVIVRKRTVLFQHGTQTPAILLLENLLALPHLAVTCAFTEMENHMVQKPAVPSEVYSESYLYYLISFLHSQARSEPTQI